MVQHEGQKLGVGKDFDLEILEILVAAGWEKDYRKRIVMVVELENEMVTEPSEAEYLKNLALHAVALSSAQQDGKLVSGVPEEAALLNSVALMELVKV